MKHQQKFPLMTRSCRHSVICSGCSLLHMLSTRFSTTAFFPPSETPPYLTFPRIPQVLSKTTLSKKLFCASFHRQQTSEHFTEQKVSTTKFFDVYVSLNCINSLCGFSILNSEISLFHCQIVRFEFNRQNLDFLLSFLEISVVVFINFCNTVVVVTWWL